MFWSVNHHIPYPRHCSPGVLFFNMGFWVGVNSKNPPKSGLFKQKVGVYSRKTPKTRLFTLPGAQFKSGAAMTRIRYIFQGVFPQLIDFCFSLLVHQNYFSTHHIWFKNNLKNWCNQEQQHSFSFKMRQKFVCPPRYPRIKIYLDRKTI